MESLLWLCSSAVLSPPSSAWRGGCALGSTLKQIRCPMNTIRVLLADDHALVRAGLRALLEAAGNIQVIGEAENGRQAVHEAEKLRPEVVVLDLAMPLLNGLEAARHITSKMPTVRVLFLSSYSDAQHLRQAVAAGVAGYLTKESAAHDLLAAIR